MRSASTNFEALAESVFQFLGKTGKLPSLQEKTQRRKCRINPKSAFKFKNGKLWLAKCKEPLNMVWSRELPGSAVPSTVTVKLDPSGRWYVSLLVDDQTVNPFPPSGKQVGIDAGINSLIATSDEEKVSNPKQFQKLYRKLRRAQKALSRKTKGSTGRQKARKTVAKIHAKISDARSDFLHKLTTDLVRKYDLIVVEDLAVKNMVKNRKLSQAISDTAWGELFRQLEYKCQWYGRKLVRIDRFFPSSKRCNHCGFVVDQLPLNIREWECPSCSSQHDRDINAGKNILAAGLAVSVCGASIRPEESKSRKAGAKKQKPKS